MTDFKALYYVSLPVLDREREQQNSYEETKANENFLNQNFTAIVKALEALDERISALEE